MQIAKQRSVDHPIVGPFQRYCGAAVGPSQCAGQAHEFYERDDRVMSGLRSRTAN